MKYLDPLKILAAAAAFCASATLASAQTTVFADDFEAGANDATVDDTTGAYSQTPDVDAAQSDGNTSGAVNSTLWVKANQGYGATRQGLVDESHGDFTDPVGEQAWAFRYTNSGLTTAEGVIGSLEPGASYTVNFNTVTDGHNGGTPWKMDFVTWVDGAARNDIRDDNDISAFLIDVNGDTSGTAYIPESHIYSYDAADANELGKDLAIRFIGATTSATVDDVEVSVTYASNYAWWDINGAATGSGGASPTGTWDAATTNWSAGDPSGFGTTAAWNPGNIALFAAGDDATGTYSVTVDGTVDIGGLYVEEGTVSLVDGTSGTLNMATSSSVVVGDGSELSIGVPITDATGAEVLTKSGLGKLTLSADNSGALGGMVLGSGITQFDSLSSINGTGANVLVNVDATLSTGGTIVDGDISTVLSRIDPTSTGTIAPDGNPAAAFDFDTAGLASAYFGAIGTVNYTGTLTPNGTTYRFNAATGSTLTLNSALTATYDLDVKGSGIIQFNGFDATMGNLIDNSSNVALQNGSATTDITLAIDVTSNQSFFGTLEDGGAATLSLTKNGGSNLTLRSDNSFTGDLTINDGRVELGSNNDTGSLNGASYPGNISIAAGSQLWDKSNTTTTYTGVISGDGSVNKGGSGVLTLAGDNTYTGQTFILGSGGGGPELSVSSFNSWQTPAASSSLGRPVTEANARIEFGNAGNQRSSTLYYTGPGETTDRPMKIGFNNSSDHRIFANGSGTLTFTDAFEIARSSGNSGASLVFTGSGDGAVSAGTELAAGRPAGDIIIPDVKKEGAGTWTLGGPWQSDQLFVSAGTLVIDGTFDSTDLDPDGVGDVTVSGGTLTVDGTLKFVSTATVSGGTLNGSGTLNFDVDGTTADQVLCTSGTLDISGLAVEIVESGSGLTEAEYILVDANAGYTGTFTGLTGASGYALDYGTADQVKLVASGGGTTYATWSGGAAADADANGDGVDNAVAYALGAADVSADATSLLPTITEDATYLTFSYNRSDEANDDVTTSIEVEYGSDLSGWTVAVDAVGGVIITETPGSPTDAVVVQIPKTLAVDGKLFARLRVVVTP